MEPNLLFGLLNLHFKNTCVWPLLQFAQFPFLRLFAKGLALLPRAPSNTATEFDLPT
jgi:hypothetical protein